MEHIVEFLRSMDEPEMANEVANAHNRLECYSTGITNDIIESLRSVAEKPLAELAAIKAENESLKRDQWQPIETAPKDGTVFLVWRKHATHPLMVRYESSYDWFANYDGEHVYDLTHWMPLPKPPAMAQGEKG